MLTLIKSPFLEYKLTILRNKRTKNSLFRQTMNEISYLIAAEVLKQININDPTVFIVGRGNSRLPTYPLY